MTRSPYIPLLSPRLLILHCLIPLYSYTVVLSIDGIRLTMAPPAGIIITVSILVAASIAAYENPHVRAWIDRTRQKVAMGLHSLGDEIQPGRPRSLRSSTDVSMMEDQGDAAEIRRQRARAEIMERSRILEDKRKRRKLSTGASPSSPSFDTLVDDLGRLRDVSQQDKALPAATSTALDQLEHTGTLRTRHQIPIEADMHQSVDAAIPLRQLSPRPEIPPPSTDLFESRYEEEMRNAWNITLPDRAAVIPSSHASESLIDLTPTTEDFPDPDYSVPSVGALNSRPSQSEYFSAAASRLSSHTASEADPEYYYAHPSQPMVPLVPRRQLARSEIEFSVSSAASTAGSTDNIRTSEADLSDDDLLSEPDGIRTPASVWTEMSSTVSADD
jgi:hypothetical protein